ncbi:hypothetical protein ACF0H5_008017 [Mactra antiquata]
MLHLEEVGTLKSNFFIKQEAPFVNPSVVSIFKQASACNPIPNERFLCSPMVLFESSGNFERMIPRRDELMSPEMSSIASIVTTFSAGILAKTEEL